LIKGDRKTGRSETTSLLLVVKQLGDTQKPFRTAGTICWLEFLSYTQSPRLCGWSYRDSLRKSLKSGAGLKPSSIAKYLIEYGFEAAGLELWIEEGVGGVPGQLFLVVI
jgi:hypothetical protein